MGEKYYTVQARIPGKGLLMIKDGAKFFLNRHPKYGEKGKSYPFAIGDGFVLWVNERIEKKEELIDDEEVLI